MALTYGAHTEQSLMPMADGPKLESLIDLMRSNSTSFIKQMEKADPTKLRNIITLLEELVAEAEAQKTSMGTAVTDAQALVDAKDTALQAANGALVSAQQAVTTAETEKNTAVGARDTAQSDANTEIPNLDAEIATLNNVIAILEGMIPSTALTLADLTNGNNGCYTIRDEQECLTSKDGRVTGHWGNSPCAWCCGSNCGGTNNVCEPQKWIDEGNHAGKTSKNALGEGSC